MYYVYACMYKFVRFDFKTVVSLFSFSFYHGLFLVQHIHSLDHCVDMVCMYACMHHFRDILCMCAGTRISTVHETWHLIPLKMGSTLSCEGHELVLLFTTHT
jgi:hypothetical protein